MKFNSIRIRAILFTLLLTLLPALIIGIIGMAYFYTIIKDNAYDDCLDDARVISSVTSNYVNSAFQYLENNSKNAGLINLVESRNDKVLNEKTELLNSSSNIFYWVFVTDSSGIVLSSSSYKEILGKNLSDMIYIREPLKTGKSTGHSTISEISGKPSYFITYPLVKNNTTVGTITGVLDRENYFNIIYNIEANIPKQYIYIVNSTGYISVHTDRKYMYTSADFSSIPAVQSLMKNEEGVKEYYSPIEKINKVVAYSPVKDYNIGVVVARPASDVYKPIDDALRLFLISLLFFAIISTILAYFAGKFSGDYILNPIKGISEAAKKLPEGEGYIAHLPISRGDELGDLARSLDEMSLKLRSTSKRIIEDRDRARFYVDVMGHDITNMNQVLLMNLELMQTHCFIEQGQQKYIENSIKTLNNSLNVVDNIKIVQKVTGEEHEPIIMDIDRIIEECINESKWPDIKKVNIEFSQGKGRIVKGLPFFKNAICNVIHYSIMNSGQEVNININILEYYSDNKKYYRIYISDNGYGIPDEVKMNMFNSRYIGSSRSYDKGLELYTAKVIIDRMGGNLIIESREKNDHKKGNLFIITLPYIENSKQHTL